MVVPVTAPPRDRGVSDQGTRDVTGRAGPTTRASTGGEASGHRGLRSLVRRFTRSNRSFHEGEERTRSLELGGTPCAELVDRHRVQVAGSVRSISLQPRSGVQALEAELADGTGSVTLIWLGRREIPGIQPGRWLRVQGLVACAGGRRTIYNPRYELIRGPGSA